MTAHRLNRSSLPAVLVVAATLIPGLVAQTPQAGRTKYFPSAEKWQRKGPAEVGLAAARLKEAVEWAEAHGSKWDFEKDQVRVFGRVLGLLPEKRAATNGIILRHGYIVAEFGDTRANDPVYSVAKIHFKEQIGKKHSTRNDVRSERATTNQFTVSVPTNDVEASRPKAIALGIGISHVHGLRFLKKECSPPNSGERQAARG